MNQYKYTIDDATVATPRPLADRSEAPESGHIRLRRASEFDILPRSPKSEMDRARKAILRLFNLYGGRRQVRPVAWILNGLDDRDQKHRHSFLALSRLINKGELEYRSPGVTAWTTGPAGRRHFGQCARANGMRVYDDKLQ